VDTPPIANNITSYITVTESIDVSEYVLKRLLNHKMRNDVTAGYIVSDVEGLREPMQRISDYLTLVINASSLEPKS
jgi:hypothetical protein